MRIAVLNDEFPPSGQSSVAIIAGHLAWEYRRLGHEVLVITTHRSERNPAIIRTNGIVSLPRSYPKTFRHYLSLWSPRMNRLIHEELSTFQPDAVHAHNVHGYLTYGSLMVARRFTPRVIITMHDVMSFAYARLTTPAFLATHGEDVRTPLRWQWHVAGLQWNPLRNVIIRQILRRSVRHTVAVSRTLARALTAHHLPRVTTVWNGMDLTSWTVTDPEIARFRAKHQLENRQTILFGGRLSEDKGTTPLLRALDLVRREIPTVMLVVIGDAKRWHGLFNLAGVPRDLESHVHCTGWLNREQMRTAFFACDLATTPSLCLDTFNLMNIEAMAAGKPVVGTIFGGTPEVVIDGETGFVCDPQDVRLYADRLITLLKDPELAARMGNTGRQRVAKEFTVEQQAAKYLRLLED